MSTLSVWTRRDPFAEFDQLVRRAFGPVPTTAPRPGFTPAAEVTRDGDDAVVRLEIPGVDAAQDVHVDVEDGRLVVHGERRDERTEQSRGRSVRELRYGSFRRSFRLPEHVTADAVAATYDAGVLDVRVTGAYATPAVEGSRRIPVTTPAAPAAVEATEATETTETTEPTESAESAE